MQWLYGKIFNKDYELSEVLNFIFPEVHSDLFSAFLILYFFPNIENALEKEANFLIVGSLSKEERTQKDETIQIILTFFYKYWPIIKLDKKDLTKKQLEEWDGIQEYKKRAIEKNVQIKKLKKFKNEFKSKEIIKICKKSEIKEANRKVFLELIGLLIKKINNKD